MKYIIGLTISLLSIFIGIVVLVGGYFYYGKIGFLEGASCWILGIAGAPTTFLYFVFYKVGMINNFITSLICIIILYLLQYQLLAFLAYKYINLLRSKKSRILFSGAILIIIIILYVSGFIMKKIILGPF